MQNEQLILKWEEYKKNIFILVEKTEKDFGKHFDEIYNTTADIANEVGDVTGDYHNAILNRIGKLTGGIDLMESGIVTGGLNKNSYYYFNDRNTVIEADKKWLENEITLGIKEMESKLIGGKLEMNGINMNPYMIDININGKITLEVHAESRAKAQEMVNDLLETSSFKSIIERSKNEVNIDAKIKDKKDRGER